MTTNTLGSTPRSPLRSLRADPVPETVLRGLHRRLEEGAARAGLLDVAFTTVSTPVGVLLLAATEEGLVRVAYAREDHEAVLQDLARRISPRVLRAPARLAPAVRQLEEYFAGTRTRFDLPLDRSLSHGFRRLVQEHLPEIGYGRTESYGAVARSVGRPQAVRAVPRPRRLGPAAAGVLELDQERGKVHAGRRSGLDPGRPGRCRDRR